MSPQENSTETIREERPIRVEIAKTVTDAVLATLSLEKGMRIMDYGCGTGLVTLALAPKGSHITAIETSPEQLDILNEKIAKAQIENIRTCCFDIEEEPWQEEPFHLIILSMTLHHMQATEAVLRKFSDALLPGGYLVLADLDSEDGNFHDGRPGVAHFGFERDRLQQLLHQADLSILRCETALVIGKDRPDGSKKEYHMFILCAQKTSNTE